MKISVSLDEEIVRELDRIAEENGYGSRNELLETLATETLTRRKEAGIY